LILWWDTATHATYEEAEGMQFAATGFVVRTTGLLIATLRAFQDGNGPLQVAPSKVRVKP